MSTMLEMKCIRSLVLAVLAVLVGVFCAMFMAAPTKADNFYKVLFSTYCDKMGNYYGKTGANFTCSGVFNMAKAEMMPLKSAILMGRQTVH